MLLYVMKINGREIAEIDKVFLMLDFGGKSNTLKVSPQCSDPIDL